ncbi:ComEC/Rec2 family competence protein [Hoeflea poritis]|uniref:ComEC/Rec2 family competence protein n=1 Tax=Hoeflea poritis TaxID=2993659 RepID=A0ABT4VSQ4_9HYPH|nr:ComEC/Rec2 family competence protein [Hoeflea poritis]MDA4847744.1 ComEC/Rec2 family competence protein [Hoeflea poritis]
MDRTEAAEDRSRYRESDAAHLPVEAYSDAIPDHGNAGYFARFEQMLREEFEVGQTILWLPVSMALGAGLWFSSDETLAILPVAILFAAVVLLLFLKDEGRWRGAFVLAAGFLVGMLASEAEVRRHGTTLLDSEITTRLEGRVINRDVDHAGRWRYTVEIERTFDPQIGRPPERVRLVARGGHTPIDIGGRISGLARLQPPSGPVLPGGFDFSFHSYFNGLGGYGFFYGAPEAIESDGVDETGWALGFQLGVSRLRAAISTRIRSVLPGDTGGFASALTVADRRGLSPDTVDALRASGLAHVLAISGLHMALVAVTFFLLLRTAFSLFPSVVQAYPVKKIAAAGALVVATFYLFLSGGSVSTQRAWIMLAIMLVAVLADRPALTMRNVALAAIVIILISPSAVLGPGFQMSFAATAALIAVYSFWRRSTQYATGGIAVPGVLRMIVFFFAGLAVTSLVAGLATGPFAVYNFHRIAAYGLLANLAAMPIVTVIVMPMGLASMLAMPFGLEYWPLLAMGAGLDVVMWIAHTVESLGGYVVVGRVSFGMFLVLTGGFLLFVLGRSKLRLIGLAVAACAAVAMVVFAGEDPDILVAEDGRLVALVSEGALAANRSRPSTFVFEQWQHALRRPDTLRPTSSGHEADARGPPELLSGFLRVSAESPGFSCAKKQFCVGKTEAGTVVAVVEDLHFLGPACDSADLVVTHRAIALDRCYSGAMLVTGRMLRQTGSLELVERDGALLVKSAIGQTNRPWTRQRFYDWRSRTYKRTKPSWLAD